MTRLFIAIDVSEDIIKYLKELQDDLRSIGDRQFKLVDEFHLTLLFIGETSDDDIPKITEALDCVSFDCFELELAGQGVFPDHLRVRVVWTGLKDNPALIKLQIDIDSSLSFLKLPKTNSFHPHLTLARVKQLSDQDRVKLGDVLEKTVDPLKCNISSFRLYKSTLSPEGPVYECLKEFPQK
jgi:2'-5' RNA ligase